MKQPPRTADRLLQAARRIVIRRGYSALNMKAVEREVKASSSLVHYHFGGKSGLVAALIDSMFRGWETWDDLPAGTSPQESLLESIELGYGMSADGRTTRLFYELLPHILRTKDLRDRLATLYAKVRATDASFARLSSRMSAEESRHLASLITAVSEGLGLQSTVDPESFDSEGAFALWKQMVAAHLHSVAAEERGDRQA